MKKLLLVLSLFMTTSICTIASVKSNSTNSLNSKTILNLFKKVDPHWEKTLQPLYDGWGNNYGAVEVWEFHDKDNKITCVEFGETIIY